MSTNITPDEPELIPEPIVGAIYGFRWWRVGPGGDLRSPWHGPYRWEPDRNQARCLVRRRLFRGWRANPPGHVDVPGRHCHCGFYGLWQVPDDVVVGRTAMLWDLDTSTSGGPHALVLGVVRATGLVLLAENGFRAQEAAPVAVATGALVTPSADLEAVPLRFGVPMYRSIRGLADAWAPRIEESQQLANAA